MAAQNGSKLHETVMLPIEDCCDNWWNPNSEKAEKFNALFDSMQEYGFLENVQVVPIGEELLEVLDDEEDKKELQSRIDTGKKWLVLQGSHRFQAAELAGPEDFPEIPAIVLEPRDIDALKALSVRMNLIRGEIDPERFTKLWEQMADKGYSEQFRMDMLGVTNQNELKTLIKETRDSLGDPELKEEFDKHRNEIRTIEDLGRVLNELFSRYGEDLAYSFMTFTFGGKTHTFVRLDKNSANLLARVKEYCRQNQVDFNHVLDYGFRAVLDADGEWPAPKAEDLSIAE